MSRAQIVGIILFVSLSILIGLGLYFMFFRGPVPITPSGTTPTTGTPGQFPSSGGATSTDRPIVEPGGQLPSSGTGGTINGFQEAGQAPTVRQLVNTNAKNINVSASGAKFYNQKDGKFYRIDGQGNVSALSDTVFFGVEQVTWSPASDESIIEYPDGSNIYYDFQTKKQVTLPQHWENFSFDTGGTQIVAKSVGFDDSNRWLIAANPDGTNVEFIEPMGNNADKVMVDWSPNRQYLALSRTGEAQGISDQKVLLIGKNGENYKSLSIPGRGLQTQWSPTGDQLLYSVYSSRSDYKPELWITGTAVGAIDSNRRPLSVQTWVEKCTFTNDTAVYCGVPTKLETGSGFQPSLANTTPDSLVRIDLKTGSRELINLDQTHTIDTIFVSDDGQKLLFTDKILPGIFEVSI